MATTGTGGRSGAGDGGSSGATGGSGANGTGGVRGTSGDGGSTGGGSGGKAGDTPGGTGGSGGGATDAGGGDSGPAAGGPEAPLPACKRTVDIANQAALMPALGAVMPGDCLVLADGSYTAPTITGAKGTADAPIVLRAEKRLGATFNGVVKIMDSAYVMLEGFTFAGSSGTSIAGTSNNCRVTRSRYFNGTANFADTARDNRLDHCEMGPRNADGNPVQPTGMSENTRIDHNYIHDVSGNGANGRETIRLGCCGATFDNHPTGNIVEHNLLVNCNGDAEIISVKSSKNTIRHNTIRSSNGNITLRAGKNNVVYGNFVFGTGNQGGLRIFDDGHVIYGNYIETGSALIANRSGPIHAAVRQAVIVHNTFLGSVRMTGTGNTFSNNITAGGESLGGATAMANMTRDAAGLVRQGDRWVIAAGSKAIDAAVGEFAFLTDDVDGQPRTKPADVGADELSTAPVLYRPLTPADVGPDAP